MIDSKANAAGVRSIGEYPSDEEQKEFEATWKAPEGIRDWFATVNNQPFGNRFMISSLVFFLIAGIMALIMRVQLAVPDHDAIGPDLYNKLFTMHGATMMFLVVLPFLEGIAIYILPLVVGSREMAFPRMSAFSFWVFFSGALIFFTGFIFNAVPDAGWFVYPPLSLERYSGLGLDFLLVGLGFIEIAGVGTGIEIVTTILKFRAPGMSLGRMPLFAWAWLVTGVMIIIAFSTLFGATVLIEFDRAIGTRFFDPEGGGNVLLWQHLFWFFGHPDVYIMFIPATGIISMIIPTFARRPIAAYSYVAVAILLTGFLSFGLWVHHMFATGIPALASGFFVAASLMIALASGVQVFAWIATLWGSRPDIKSPLLFVLGFLCIFVLGGITGVMVAVLPFDLQAHDTYFVVAHFHYVLIGGVIFPILGGLHYWLPLMTGYLPSERLARWSFWLIFIGFNLTFFPMHVAGLLGMSRRVYTYSASLNVGWYNLLSSVSSFILGAGFVIATINLLGSRYLGRKAGKNPWNSGALEWSLMVDMPNYVFRAPPVILAREPLWQAEAGGDSYLNRLARQLTSRPSAWRATLITDAISGEPQAIQKVSTPSYVPITAAIGLFIMSVATLFKAYILALAALVFTLGVVCYWLWPEERELKKMRESGLGELTGLPLEPTGALASGWWAMVGTLTVIGTIFGVLFYSYFYIRIYSPSWPQGGIALPEIWPSSIFYAALLLGALSFHWAEKNFQKNSARASLLGISGSLLAALIFLASSMFHIVGIGFTPQENAYASLFHTITWHLAALVLGGAMFLAALLIKTIQSQGQRTGYLILQLQVTGLYWYFTAVVGVLSFATLFLSPYLL